MELFPRDWLGNNNLLELLLFLEGHFHIFLKLRVSVHTPPPPALLSLSLQLMEIEKIAVIQLLCLRMIHLYPVHQKKHSTWRAPKRIQITIYCWDYKTKVTVLLLLIKKLMLLKPITKQRGSFVKLHYDAI